jgi:hypothetical protein
MASFGETTGPAAKRIMLATPAKSCIVSPRKQSSTLLGVSGFEADIRRTVQLECSFRCPDLELEFPTAAHHPLT